MIKKISTLMMLSLLAIGGIGQISYAASNTDVLGQSPFYVLVEMGCDGSKCNPDTLRKITGSVEATGAKLAIAKGIGITASETLTNEFDDIGRESAKIDFSFSTAFKKGFVLKVFPNADFDESAVLDFKYTEGGLKRADPYLWPFLERGYYADMDTSLGLTMTVIDFAEGANLSARNAAFKNKLLILPKLISVDEWAQAKAAEGKIDLDLYGRFAQLTHDAWLKNYSDEDVYYFNWRFNRLKKNLNDKKVSPVLFYGGLNVLMKRFK
ncbi:hypothetical protein IT411_03435 [Candidatus Peregrinibacteria bacterium]|nr:hypothetical protein [Candidatus Peregrinibacteria bacterium]